MNADKMLENAKRLKDGGYYVKVKTESVPGYPTPTDEIVGMIEDYGIRNEKTTWLTIKKCIYSSPKVRYPYYLSNTSVVAVENLPTSEWIEK